MIFPYCTIKPSLVPIGLQLFKWGHFHIFSLSYNLTYGDRLTWYLTFDLINKWRFPCCIYDPTLVEIHQSMWTTEPNVNLFSQQTATDIRQQHQHCWCLLMTTTSTLWLSVDSTDNHSGQIDPYVCFLLRQATQTNKQTKKKKKRKKKKKKKIWWNMRVIFLPIDETTLWIFRPTNEVKNNIWVFIHLSAK